MQVSIVHDELGKYHFFAGPNPGDGSMPNMLYTDNESNPKRLWGMDSEMKYFKDAFHTYVIEGDESAVNPKKRGTKVQPLPQLALNSVTLLVASPSPLQLPM